MSDAIAEIFDCSGTLLGYSVYQGSSDNVYPGIQKEQTWELQSGRWEAVRDCEHNYQRRGCRIYSRYAGGFWWPSEYCSECMVITGQLSPYGNEYGYEGPDQAQRTIDNEWSAGGWPRKEHPFPGSGE